MKLTQKEVIQLARDTMEFIEPKVQRDVESFLAVVNLLHGTMHKAAVEVLKNEDDSPKRTE